MKNIAITHWAVIRPLLCLLLILWSNGQQPPSGFAASPIYWCPDRKTDQQYSSKPDHGCVPLIEKKDTAPNQEIESANQSANYDFKVEELRKNVSAFLAKYRKFLDCCKTDLTELQHVEELGHELSEILNSAQAQLSNYSFASRGVMIGDMIRTVAIARADLRTLHARLEQIGDAASKQAYSDFENAGREAEIARDVEESIQRDIGAPTLPSSARTGSDIGKAPSAGPGIGRTPKTGSAIGNEGRTGEDIGFSPRNSRDIGGNGPTGFEIGATGRAGPMIGESSFNHEDSSEVDSSLQRSTVGSNLQDSTVSSNLRPSSIGSNLEDSTVGSSFGGSSVSSSLQNRGTGSPR